MWECVNVSYFSFIQFVGDCFIFFGKRTIVELGTCVDSIHRLSEPFVGTCYIN